MRAPLCMVLLGALMLTTVTFAQDNNNLPAVASCTFEDNTEISVRYNPAVESKVSDLPNGKLWPADGSPMLLFTGAELRIGDGAVPVGAYSMYVIPGKQQWTLVVNRNVTHGAKYDEKEDVLRTAMDVGQLSSPVKEVQVGFGRTAPKKCGMRFYFGKIGAWADINEK